MARFTISRPYDERVNPETDPGTRGSAGSGEGSSGGPSTPGSVEGALSSPAEAAPSFRVLVDRLWPRGIKKAELELDAWDKDVAPSNALRKEYHAGGVDFATFQRMHAAELAESHAAEALAARIEEYFANGGAGGAASDEAEVVLLTAAKHPESSHVPLIRDVLAELLAEG